LGASSIRAIHLKVERGDLTAKTRASWIKGKKWRVTSIWSGKRCVQTNKARAWGQARRDQFRTLKIASQVEAGVDGYLRPSKWWGREKDLIIGTAKKKISVRR
jgi:hypothetical protein